MAENDEKQLAIQKIYVKDFSFESPKTPQVFSQTDLAPKTDFNLRSTHTAGSENNHEIFRRSTSGFGSTGSCLCCSWTARWILGIRNTAM